MGIFKAGICFTLLGLSTAVLSQNTPAGEAKPFNCIDKNTLTVIDGCMSQKIETNLVFRQAEDKVLELAKTSSDKVMSTVTFDEQKMVITVLAHKDASIALVDSKKLKKD